VRELAERGVLQGQTGAYVSTADVSEARVPATLQATIAARIDRLDPKAKRTLSAAAVIGSKFSRDLLEPLGIDPVLDDLVSGELIDQITFTGNPAYVFHHPLIRTVAYESQLKSDRAELHRRLAAAIEAREPQSADQNAALIAEHVEAAGDLHGAYAWHMRAATWATNRDIGAAHTSWRRARQVADRLPDDDPDRMANRITPRTLLCASAWRVGGSGADTGFNELRELCAATGDQRSLAIGMAGLVTEHFLKANRREASRLAAEHVELLESIGDPTLAVALSFAALVAKQDTGEMAEVMRWAQRVIDLAEGDPAKGNLIIGSPLAVAIAWRGTARWCLGIAGWNDDVHQAIATAHAFDPTTFGGVIWFTYVNAIAYGVLKPDAIVLRNTAEALAVAEQSGDDFALDLARGARGVALVHLGGPQHEAGLNLLAKIRERAMNQRFALMALPIMDIHFAREKARLGDLDGAVELARTVVDDLFASGGCIWSALATTVLVEALAQRRGNVDLEDVQTAIDRLAAVPTDPGFVLNELALLRLQAMLARAHGDETAYGDYRDRYRAMARSLGFEGHIALAEAMP